MGPCATNAVNDPNMLHNDSNMLHISVVDPEPGNDCNYVRADSIAVLGCKASSGPYMASQLGDDERLR